MDLDQKENCPKCNIDLKYIKDGQGYSKVIGIEYLGKYDGIAEWRCPSCGYREGRFSGKELKDNEWEEV